MTESLPTAAVTILDPLRIPLHGSRLIEASAGTGKTWTIAQLYLRLILGHGRRPEATPLMPPDILVVTFTEAATRELRDRIRGRLAEAATLFRGQVLLPGESPDAALLALRAEWPEAEWSGCARRLDLAAQWMDEAAVSTIHGWCRRMLREHAFDSGSAFDLELTRDETELLDLAIKDYWRETLYPLPAEAARGWLETFSDPASLLAVVKERILLECRGAREAADEQRSRLPPASALQTLAQWRSRDWPAARQALAETLDAFERELRDLMAAGAFNGTRLRESYINGWMAGFRQWLAQPQWEKLIGSLKSITESACNRLTREGLLEACKPAWQSDPRVLALCEQPFLAALQRVQTVQAERPEVSVPIVAHATEQVARRLQQEKRRRALQGFDDLLHALDHALRGDGGEVLAERIRRRYPVALVDEFQDTDPVQYRLFDRIYRIADNDPALMFFMIGDPKQAIYSFRGADIHAYLQARQATAGRHYTLGRNFRSTRALVDAVNHCFAVAAERQGGAFRLLLGEGESLPFHPVDARGREEQLQIEGREATPLTLWHATQERPLNKADALSTLASACATEILRLLQGARTTLVGFQSDQGFVPLRSGDIAVLVNTGHEAAEVRRQLRLRGIASVYLSERDSVLSTVQALDLFDWLQACAQPERESALRAALATATLGLSLERLDRLRSDELAWEQEIERFRGYRDCWRRHGVLAMIWRLLHDFEVPSRWLCDPAGERVLTDLLHLAELLQQASQSLDGEQALIRVFAEWLQAPAEADEQRQVRLESDADLVQVVTVHKSKGLEYPLVFLPFACLGRTLARRGREFGRPLVWHDAAGQLWYSPSPDEAQRQQADAERWSEDLRKLYVAMTRARHATWMGALWVGEIDRLALGHLLGVEGGAAPVGRSVSEDPVTAALSVFPEHPAIAMAPLPPVERDVLPPLTADEAPVARVMERSVATSWWIASYSTLVAAVSNEEEGREPTRRVEVATATSPPIEVPETARHETLVEELRREAGETSTTPTGLSMQTLHRGAVTGNALHAVLEWAAGLGFAEVLKDPEALGDEVARCFAAHPDGEAAIQVVCQWLPRFLQQELVLPRPGASAGIAVDSGVDSGEGSSVDSVRVRWGDLRGARPEMEFLLACHDVDARAIDRLVCSMTFAGQGRPRLTGLQLSGMLKGFIDLVFEVRGCYYVADYKSNWLGPSPQDYTTEVMTKAVLKERYDLQFCLYLLALHRLLSARLPDYDYDRHVGGAVYCFLRGIEGPAGGSVIARPPRGLIEALDRLFRLGVPAAPELPA